MADTSAVSGLIWPKFKPFLPNISLWWYLFKHSKVAKSLVSSPILLKYELIQDISCYNFINDPINSNREKVESSIFRRSRTANSIVSGWIWPEFELIQTQMHGLDTCKNEGDPIKNEGLE